MPMIRSAVATVMAAASFAPAAAARETCDEAYASAQERRLDGDLASARDELLVCSAPSCPRVTTGDCTRWLREVENDLPTLLVVVTGKSGEPANEARLWVDSKPRDAGKPVWLNAGDHVVRCESTTAWGSEHVFLSKSEHGRTMSCELVHPFEAPTERVPPGAGHLPLGGFVLGGVGLTSVIIGAIVAAKGVSDRSSLESECAPACAPDRTSSVHTTLVAADVTVGVGLGAVAGGAFWLIFGREKGAPPVTVTSVLLPGRVALGVSGRF